MLTPSIVLRHGGKHHLSAQLLPYNCRMRMQARTPQAHQTSF